MDMNNMNIKLNIEFGWVRLHPPQPVFDQKGRIVSWEHRITDSDGRDEILDGAVRLVYND